jgi:cytochrome c oxidase subunit 1
MSSAGASILGVGYLIPMIYLAWAWRNGKKAPQNPWNAKGLEWEQAPSPPPTFNFVEPPTVTEEPYHYSSKEVEIV